VSEEVRERVAAAAAELRYRPNRRARSMKSRWTRTIGVVVGDIQLPYFGAAVRAIADAAQTAGSEVILANTNEDPSRERAVVQMLHEERVDGLIIAPASSEEDDHLRELADLGVPIVLLDRRTMHLDVDAVVTDNSQAMARAVGLLARLGHERIGIIVDASPIPSPTPVHLDRLTPTERQRVEALVELKPALARYKGYVDGMRAGGLPIDDRLIRHADYSRESATAQAESLLAQSDPATAVVTTDSLVTMGVLAAVRQAGLRMPHDVSLIGFDDAEWATVMVPSITVIAQPVPELGARAAKRLLDLIAGDAGPPEVQMLENHLVFRESTGPPGEGSSESARGQATTAG
jgi:LacI family transcriptional regulator